MKRIFVPLLLASASIMWAAEPAQEIDALGNLPPELKFAVLTVVSQTGKFEEAMASIKSLRLTNKSFQAVIDSDAGSKDIIRYVADFYKKDPIIAALYLGTPAAQRWVSKQASECPKFKARVLYTMNNLISKAWKIEGINQEKAILFLKDSLPQISEKAWRAKVKEAVKKKNNQALAVLLREEPFELNYEKNTSPELGYALNQLLRVADKARVYRRTEGLTASGQELESQWETVKKESESLRNSITLLINRGAQISADYVTVIKQLKKRQAFTKDDIELIERTQKVLQKKK